MFSRKPFSFEPMLCESAERPPEGRDWRYELKLDGFRAIGRKSGPSAQLWSRNQKDFTRRFPDVVKGIAELPSDTVIDAEIVALDETGEPSFHLLHGLWGGASAIVLYAFDLLMLRGKDVRLWPLSRTASRDRPAATGHNPLFGNVQCGAFRIGAGCEEASARRHCCQARRQPIPVR
jgi:ATP-dependent DNA ligase